MMLATVSLVIYNENYIRVYVATYILDEVIHPQIRLVAGCMGSEFQSGWGLLKIMHRWSMITCDLTSDSTSLKNMC